MNKENTQAALARTADLAVQEIPDEILVYDLRRHKAFCLNKTAAFVWRHCDGQTTITEMTRLLGNEMGAPVAEELIWYTFDKLEKAHLLEVKVTPPGGTVISRRLLAKSLGVGTLLAVPTVISLVAPTAAQAQSVVVTSQVVADGTCNNPPAPAPNPMCFTDTCCIGSNMLCQGTVTASSCSGGPCTFTGTAMLCNL
jgi:hypothetical protein